MADKKSPSHAEDDKKKTTVKTTTKTEKHDEKKDENILERTAHSIREKVHDFAEEVKEKTHLKHGDDAKKSKSHLKTSSHPPKIGKKDSGEFSILF